VETDLRGAVQGTAQLDERGQLRGGVGAQGGEGLGREWHVSRLPDARGPGATTLAAMLSHRVLTLPFAVGLVVATIAGCGGSTPAEPTPTPTVATSVAPTATETATPETTETPAAPTDGSSPTAPAALDQTASVEGAQDVARYFMELYPYVLRTGDVAPWTALSSPACTTCGAVADGAANPDPASKQAVDIRTVTATEDAPGTFTVTMDMYETPRVAPDIVHFIVTLVLVHDGQAWQVQSVDPARQES